MINLSTDQRNRLIATVLGTLAAVIGLFFSGHHPIKCQLGSFVSGKRKCGKAE